MARRIIFSGYRRTIRIHDLCGTLLLIEPVYRSISLIISGDGVVVKIFQRCRISTAIHLGDYTVLIIIRILNDPVSILIIPRSHAVLIVILITADSAFRISHRNQPAIFIVFVRNCLPIRQRNGGNPVVVIHLHIKDFS